MKINLKHPLKEKRTGSNDKIKMIRKLNSSCTLMSKIIMRSSSKPTELQKFKDQVLKIEKDLEEG